MQDVTSAKENCVLPLNFGNSEKTVIIFNQIQNCKHVNDDCLTLTDVKWNIHVRNINTKKNFILKYLRVRK